jgi:NHL repeat
VFLALALSVSTLLAVSTGVACAETPRLIPDGQFESVGALGIAVDQSESSSDPSRGDVYVAGFATEQPNPATKEEGFVPGGVNKFDPSGNVLKPPSPVGEAFAYSGAAVNPVDGDVYALDAISSQVDTYDPASGGLLGSFSVSASENYGGILAFFGIHSTVVEIATDSAGDVYVPVVPKNEVLEYDPATCPAVSEPCVPMKTFTGGSGTGALKEPVGVAVDSSGHLWVADTGNNRIEEFGPSGTPVEVNGKPAEILSEGVQSVAVDPRGDIFATVNNSQDFCGSLHPPCPHLVEYSSTGAQLADLGAGLIGAEAGRQGAAALQPLNMVAVSDSSGSVYVTEAVTEPRDVLHSRVFKFTPPVAPSLEGELASEVGVSEAKLGAVVNPGGISAVYRFEYGTTTAYGNSVPFPEGDTGAGFTSRTVWAGASGLQPGTTYHYRVVVTSELGGALVGEDKTFTTETAAQASCKNERLRTGFSANLPDCRAYELVTPPNKTGAQPDPPEENGEEGVVSAFKDNFAAVDGNRYAFQAEDIFPGANSGAKSYVATRGPSSWSSQNMFPPTNYYGYECPDKQEASGYSADLSKALVLTDGGGECGGPEPELVSGEPKGVQNLFVRDNTTGSYQLVNVPAPGVTPTSATFVAASADLSHVLFREQAKLTSNALNEPAPVIEHSVTLPGNLYEWSGGVVRLVPVLPDETPVTGLLAGISHNGSATAFTYAGNLYARVDGTGTVQLDASQVGGPGGGGSLVSFSADGSQALFSDDASAGLTSDTVPGSGANLYIYDFATGRLTDLTPRANAEVTDVMGTSEDGSYVYFDAAGVLAAGATQGQSNPYVWHAGTTTFIASLANVAREHLEVSTNGAFLAFASTQRLTGYDNTDASSGQPDFEVYLYSAASGNLVCASCNPSDAPPTGGPRWGSDSGLAPHELSEDGRVFFDTREGLLPADTNGQRDVYEFEPDGVGSCGDPGGCLSLISTGTSPRESWFLEASPSGNDVFLLEHQSLVLRDTSGEARTIYDARVEGGLPEPPPPPSCTTADACRTAPAPQPSIFGAPASQTFSGVGNLAAPPPAGKTAVKSKKCKRGFVKKKGMCVKKKPKRKARRSVHANRKRGR